MEFQMIELLCLQNHLSPVWSNVRARERERRGKGQDVDCTERVVILAALASP